MAGLWKSGRAAADDGGRNAEGAGFRHKDNAGARLVRRRAAAGKDGLSVKDGAMAGMKGLRSRLAGGRMRALLPLALLLAAMSSVFLFGGDRGGFQRGARHHSYLSSHHLTIAANLSPKHNFLMHTERTLGDDGAVEFAPYNRFPIGGYALIKLAILPFVDNLSAQIYAARTLMLAMFAATAALAYLSVSRLVGNRWAALSATLLAFSSGYLLHYNDMIATEVGMDLFGVMLAFHGMVVFAREGRFRQLLVKVCAAAFLGWHVYALLLPFIAIGLAGELVGALRASSALPALARARRVLGALARSRSAALGAAALALGLAALAFNFGNEYLALRGETALSELPSVESTLARAGIRHSDIESQSYLNWTPLLKNQFARVGAMLIPFAFNANSEFIFGARDSPGHFLVLGLAAAAACAAGLFFTRDKALWAALALAGFCWALPMRRMAAVHSYEAVYHAGIALFLFTLALVWVGKRGGAGAARGLSVAAIAVFAASAFWASQSIYARGGADPSESELRAARAGDFEAIRKIAKGKTVFISDGVDSGGARYETHFYMNGNVLVWEHRGYAADFIVGKSDFIASKARQDADELLTPGNREVFLYDNRKGAYTGIADSLAEKAEPIQVGEGLLNWLANNAEPIHRGEWDVYAHGGRVYYIGAPGTFQAASLSEKSPAVGDRIDAELNIGRRAEEWRWERGKDGEGWTAVAWRTRSASNRIYIPAAADIGYRIRARVNYIDSGGAQAEAVAAPTEAVSEFRAAGGSGGASGETLRFFLHITPVDENDLPDVAKPHGFQNLDFNFDSRILDPGPDSRRAAMVELPPYPIAAIKTGQRAGEGKLWEARARLEGGEWLADDRTDGGGE